MERLRRIERSVLVSQTLGNCLTLAGNGWLASGAFRTWTGFAYEKMRPPGCEHTCVKITIQIRQAR